MSLNTLLVVKKKSKNFRSNIFKFTFNNIIAIPVFCTPVSIAIAVTSSGFCRKRIEVKQPNINPHQGRRRPLKIINLKNVLKTNLRK